MARSTHGLSLRRRLRVTELTYREAIAAAIGDELEADPDVVFFGEDVGAAGGRVKSDRGPVREVRSKTRA